MPFRFALVAAVAVTTLRCATQLTSAPPAASDGASLIAAARRMMIATRYCALITIGEDGQPQARTIDPSPPDSRMVVTFATNPSTRKVRQIERDPRVTLYYFDARSPGYVVVIGTATKVDANAAHWLEKWTPFYPGGASEAIVFEVTPARIEIVDVARGIIGDPRSWVPPSVNMSGHK